LSNPDQKELHRKYIRQCLENFNGNNGVIQLISEEFTGPLHFVQFWVDVINEWEAETGRIALVGLSTTKDVQDAILTDPVRSKVVDLIDIRYWLYREDGSAYAPLGGQNLAPRQHARLVKPGKTSFDQVYRAVREYHSRFPEKAATYSADSYDSNGWAVFMAGGSLPVLPEIEVSGFLESASGMAVVEGIGEGQYKLQNKQGECIIYFKKGSRSELDLKASKGKFRLIRINPVNGATVGKPQLADGGKTIKIEWNAQEDMVLWLVKN